MVATLAVTTLLCASIWLLLTGGDPTSWIVGVPVVISANLVIAWSGVRLSSPAKIGSLLHFASFFLHQSVRSGFDVAGRVLTPTLRIKPGMVRYRTGLSSPSAQAWFMTLVTMLPGTLSVHGLDGEVDIHVLDKSSFNEADLHGLERHLTRLFDAGTAT